MDEPTSFYALQVGNYWKYQYHKTDPQGNPIEEIAIEEVEVLDEVEIDGSNYFQLQISTTDPDGNCVVCEEEAIVNRFVKDSLGYLVTSDHEILYSSIETTPVLASDNEWGDVYFQLQEAEVTQTVPAGTFDCNNNLWYAIDPEGLEYPGTDIRLFASQIGMVRITFSGVSSGNMVAEKILVDYSLITE